MITVSENSALSYCRVDLEGNQENTTKNSPVIQRHKQQIASINTT